MKEIALTVLSNGAGQDTTYLIHRLLHDKAFYDKHVEGRLLIVGSDTGDEHKHTYKNVEIVKELCKQKAAEFYWIDPSQGFHSPTWQSLTGQYKKNGSIGSAAFRQSCTDNLKVKVVDRFVEHWIAKNYYQGILLKRKRTYHAFHNDFGGIRLILGFAAGEDTRTSNGNKYDPVWKKLVTERHYPLIEEGVDRAGAIAYNASVFDHKVYPSNCKRCFYQSDQEILWLYRNEPEDFKEWVEMEQVKLKKYEGKEGVKNLGVYGKITLEQKLQRAIEKYGHMTDAELDEYKFSHGHCIKSKY